MVGLSVAMVIFTISQSSRNHRDEIAKHHSYELPKLSWLYNIIFQEAISHKIAQEFLFKSSFIPSKTIDA